MSRVNGLPANFSISPRAKTAIEQLRRDWDYRSEDKAAVPCIAWGTTTVRSGRGRDHVVVTFYGKSQWEEVKRGVERVSGVDLIFFITPENYDRFAGRVLDYNPERWFFLT